MEEISRIKHKNDPYGDVQQMQERANHLEAVNRNMQVAYPYPCTVRVVVGSDF